MRVLVVVPVALAALIFVPLPFAWLSYFSNPPRQSARSAVETRRQSQPDAQREEQVAPGNGSTAEKLNIAPLTSDEARLTLYRHIDAGVSYTALKEALPGLSSLQHEAYGGLSEAFLKLQLFGFPAEVEFNFKDRRLYNFYYNFHTGPDTDSSEVLLNSLTEYLSARFDRYREETYQEDANYRVKRMIWSNAAVNASVTRGLSAGADSIVLSFDRVLQGDSSK